MKLRKLIVLNLAALAVFCSPFPAGAKTGARLDEIVELATGGRVEEALKEVRKYLEELKASNLEPDHPAIGMAAATAGQVASMAGEHEEAVGFLREGLPIISEKLRDGRLMADEFGFSMTLAASLKKLDRKEEALAVLEPLLERSRQEVARTKSGPVSLMKGNTDDGQQVGLETVMAKDEWVGALQMEIGNLRLENKQWAEAEVALKEAAELMQELHPEQQADIVKLREGWEQAAREQGKPVRPRHVGRFSSPRTIRFEGAKLITPPEIHSALARSNAYVLASHPSADFDEYLTKLQRCLVLGYRESGFPDVTVEVEWAEADDAVVARIVEGSRFRKGEIRIHGAKVLSTEKLLDDLILEKDETAELPGRAESAYLTIAKNKHLPEATAREAIREFFPGRLPDEKETKEKEKNPLAEFNMDWMGPSTPSAKGIWTKGDWVPYQDSYLSAIKNAFLSSYAAEGYFFPKVEVKWVPQTEPGILDVEIEVSEEGPSARIGRLRVVGNRVHSKAELLDYLGLKEGMALKGEFMERIKRQLFESGRFLGWEVTAMRAEADSSKIDLLVHVAEHWEAPPLSQPLTREQEVLLRFATWFNTRAGAEEDFVFNVSGDSDSGPMAAEFAVGSGGIAFSADGSGHRIRATGEWGHEAELLIRTNVESAFRAAFPIGGLQLTAYFTIFAPVPEDPYSFRMSTINFGATTTRKDGIEEFSTPNVAVGIDPTRLLAASGSWYFEGQLPRFEGGEMVLDWDGLVVRIEEQSGRLISLRYEEGSGILTGKTEVGAVTRMRKETQELSRDIPNWMEGKHPLSLPFMAVGYLAELGKLMLDEEFDGEEFNAAMSREAARRAGRWTPLANALGDVFESFTNEAKATPEQPFTIPIDTEDMNAKMQAGGTLSFLLGFGLYDLIAEYIEPGTWPDLVTREMLFYLDGKPFYLNQTIETLLEDEAMGPFGAVICARLLQRARHPAAARFAAKAKEELNPEAFAKDWRLALRGSAKDEGAGWKLLGAFRSLTEEQIDAFTPADPPDIRATLKALAAQIREINPQTTADALSPIMDSLWEKVLGEVMAEAVSNLTEELVPKVDARLVAATVNGHPVFRGVIRLNESVGSQAPPPMGDNRVEKSVAMLLFAQELWNEGQSATPASMEQMANAVANSMGADGWEQIAAQGLTKEQFQWWNGVEMAANAHLRALIEAGKIEDSKVREYYESHAAQFGAGPETLVHKMTFEAAERKKAEAILQRVKQAKDMDAMVKAFKKEGGQSLGWVNASGFVPALAKAIESVPEKSLSDVLETRIKGQDYFHLVLIPDARRQGKAKPFKDVEALARVYALIDRELALLRKRAQIEIFEEPDENVPVPELADEKPNKALQNPVVDGLFSIVEPLVSGGETGIPGSAEEEEEEPLSLELVLRKVGEGSAEHLYILGAYAEQGLGPVPGMKPAVAHYEKAAEGGERRAMLRLSELYRTGHGVERDEAEAQRWKEKATKSPEPKAAPEDAAVVGPESERVTDIDVQFFGEARIEKEKILALVKTKVGRKLESDVIDEDIRRLYESGLVENIRMFSEPHDGGLRLIIFIEVSWLSRGFELMDEGRLAEAVALFQSKIDRDPTNSTAHSLLGGTLSKQHKFEDAVASFRRAIKLDPEDAVIHRALADCLQAQGKFEDAVTSYRRAIELDPEDPISHHNLAYCFTDLGKYEDAVAFYRRAIELDPDLVENEDSLPIWLRDSGRFGEARSVLGALCKSDLAEASKAHLAAMSPVIDSLLEKEAQLTGVIRKSGPGDPSVAVLVGKIAGEARYVDPEEGNAAHPLKEAEQRKEWESGYLERIVKRIEDEQQ